MLFWEAGLDSGLSNGWSSLAEASSGVVPEECDVSAWQWRSFSSDSISITDDCEKGIGFNYQLGLEQNIVEKQINVEKEELNEAEEEDCVQIWDKYHHANINQVQKQL